MEFLILVAILIGTSRTAYLIGKKSAAVTDSAKLVNSIADAVNQAANTQVEQLMTQLFTHYQEVIVKGTPEQATDAMNQLNVKMNQAKSLQTFSEKFDSALNTIKHV
jgi:predicted transcriptional regulator